MAVGLLAGSLYLGAEVFVAESTREFVTVATTTLWQAFVGISLLVHARYVVHVSNEVHLRVPSRIVQLRDFIRHRWQLVKEQIQIEDSDEDQFGDEDAKKRVSSRPAPNRQKAAAETQQKHEAKSADKSNPPAPKPKRRVLGTNAIRVDQAESTKAPKTAPATEQEPDDEVDLSKLSKKERRRLRKQMKRQGT